MDLGRGQWLVYIGRSINFGPLDQTNLKERRRCNLGGGGEPTFEAEADWWDPRAGWPTSGADWPHMVAPQGLLRWRASWSLLDPSHIDPTVEFHDFL